MRCGFRNLVLGNANFGRSLVFAMLLGIFGGCKLWFRSVQSLAKVLTLIKNQI